MSDKLLYDNEWLQLMTTDDGYVYTHSPKNNGKGIAVLVFNSLTNHILGRYEDVPCHGKEYFLGAITGMCDKEGFSKEDIVISELKEEAGIIAKKEELINLGWIHPSKASDTIIYLYALDACNKILIKPTGDGTEGEKNAYVKWVSLEQIFAECHAPSIFTSILKLRLKGIDLLSNPISHIWL